MKKIQTAYDYKNGSVTYYSPELDITYNLKTGEKVCHLGSFAIEL